MASRKKTTARTTEMASKTTTVEVPTMAIELMVAMASMTPMTTTVSTMSTTTKTGR